MINFFSGVARFLLVEGDLLIVGVGGLWRPIVGGEGSSPGVFDIGPGGTKILGILAVRSLGVFFLFPLWILLEGGGMLFKQSSHLGSRFSSVIVLIVMSP